MDFFLSLFHIGIIEQAYSEEELISMNQLIPPELDSILLTT